MCGRYALSLRAAQIRQMLQEDDMPVDYSVDEEDGPGAPRQSYNFAPGYHGVVYRADTPDWGAGPQSRPHQDKDVDATGDGVPQSTASEHSSSAQVKYKLQSMKWGLVPFWTKRNPDYQTIMRTINCRDDSLSSPGGMWASMKNKKRCIVVAEGFFEWLKTGPKDKLPHFVKRKDGRLMCFAGLWDCVQYEDSDEKLYTYTIITTDSNEQLKFLHDRMPVLFNPGSEKIKQWLDPGRYEWSRDLQALLKPFDGELEVYPVSKDVGKVGNSSPSFIIPLDSRENKSNIANFFANAKKQNKEAKEGIKKKEVGTVAGKETKGQDAGESIKHESGASAGVSSRDTPQKRKADSPVTADSPPTKKMPEKGKISSTKNEYRSPKKTKTAPGTQKITSFFGNSA